MSTPRKPLGLKRPCPAGRVVLAVEKKAKQAEEMRSRREGVVLKHAPKIAELAEKALVAIQELMAAESAAKEEINEQFALFTSDDNTLEDAELAISTARFTAENALKKRRTE